MPQPGPFPTGPWNTSHSLFVPCVVKLRTYRVESVVDDVFEIFAHSDLSHQLVLVTVHAGQLAHMGKDVLKTIRQLKGVHVVKTILHVGVHDQLCQAQNFTTQVECYKSLNS
jgi:EAL domain-containing protein (putative c-di-GMP-specific phosphodiesterase class I)